MGVREVADYFSISSHSSVVMWLQCFEKYGIDGLIRQPNRKHKMRKRKVEGDEKLYLSPMMDLANREIIDYHIGHRPNFALVATMLKKTLVQLKEKSYQLFIAFRIVYMS